MDLCRNCLARGDEDLCGRHRQQGICEIAETWALTANENELASLEKQVARLEEKNSGLSDDFDRAESLRLRANSEAKELREQIPVLEKKVLEITNALRFYAADMLYFPRSIILECQSKGVRLAPIYSEFGDVARATLGLKTTKDAKAIQESVDEMKKWMPELPKKEQ